MSERTRLSENIAAIDSLVAAMAAKTGELLRMAILALKNQDLELAKTVKTRDAEIDALQHQIEDEVIVNLATQQPVASDLRVFIAAFKVAGDLERAADFAVHLAKAVKKFAQEPKFKQAERLAAMAEIGCDMLHGVAEAFRLRSLELAVSTASLDDSVDAEHKAIIEETLVMMRERPVEADKAAKLLSTSGFLERLGDHMTNACEAIVYMVNGTRVELNQ